MYKNGHGFKVLWENCISVVCLKEYKVLWGRQQIDLLRIVKFRNWTLSKVGGFFSRSHFYVGCWSLRFFHGF